MTPLSVAYLPLTDAAPLIVAEEMGYAREEGLHLDLRQARSWSRVRDMLCHGEVDAAHLLAPIPVAMALGLGNLVTPLSALMVLSVNGTVIGVAPDIATRMREAGHAFDFADARAARDAVLKVAGRPLRFGVPYPFSMQAELLHYWLNDSLRAGAGDLAVRTVPPPMMAEALAAGEIDAFCVGEPWGSRSVETGAGHLLLPGQAVWSFAPEKVLAVRSGWADSQPELAARLMHAVWKAARWLSEPGAHTTAAEILARHIELDAHVLDRALTGRITINGSGDVRQVPCFMEFFDGAATFPWKSQAAWIGDRLARRHGLDPQSARIKAKAVFRSDLYRRNLMETGAAMPGASEKLEGASADPQPVATERGRLILARNRFFDGRIFDPAPQN